ncbi:L-asparagine permease [Raoultella planticola]|uniref:L-asparagine permease n=1 Tax=Raoultella planticola TaxID=575 RepID=A0A485AK02_RAOPL|nr:L-asparagine permease [Raoultella planticola]
MPGFWPRWRCMSSGVFLNYLVPSQVFEIVLNVGFAGGLSRRGALSWSGQMRLR